MRALPWVFVILCVWTAAAQVDEQPPVIRRVPSSSSPDPAPSGKSGKKAPDTISASGIVQRIDDKNLEVAIDDGRFFKAAIDSKTAFIGPGGRIDPSTITTGTRVRISVRFIDDQQNLAATSVVVEKPAAAPEDDAMVRKTEDTDPDRPVLKRGVPAKVARKDDDSAASEEPDRAPAEAVATSPVKATADDDSLASVLSTENQPDLLRKAKEVNMEFIAHLPNFVCQQFTTRYQRDDRITGWQAKDIVSATVIYENRKERYENIKINNRSASNNSDMMAIKGATSTGEFGSFLEGLFATDVQAEFQYVHAELFRQVHTKVFDYTVKRENTDWTVSNGGQSIRPAYSGRVWIDAETGRVMRIEREAVDIPEAFPFKVVEQTLDYDKVMLGGRKILLPVESSNLACDRNSPACSKNVIQFRDYKEFRGDASITFDPIAK
jgi:hypothetical protein